MSAQLWSGELSVEIVGDLLLGGYLRAVKCDCLVLSFGRLLTIYCLDSSPQFCRVCLMIPRLHKLSPIVSVMFVRYSGDLIVHLWQCGRGRVSGSDVISCSHLLQYFCWIRLCVESVSSRDMWCDAALRMMARKIFSPFWQLVGSRILLSLSSISLLYTGPSLPGIYFALCSAVDHMPTLSWQLCTSNL